MTLRKIAIAAAVSSAMLVTSIYFSPHWTVYRMRSAIEHRDYKAFSSHADFPALRESFKRQLMSANAGSGDDPRAGDHVLKRLGQDIAGLVAGPMIDAVVGPAGVMEMLNAGIPEISRSVIKSTITQVPAAGEAMPDMRVAYRGWNRAAFRDASASENEGSFVLIRSGLWSWRLAEVELPGQR